MQRWPSMTWVLPSSPPTGSQISARNEVHLKDRGMSEKKDFEERPAGPESSGRSVVGKRKGVSLDVRAIGELGEGRRPETAPEGDRQKREQANR
ncbi:hypothetical protein FGG08_000189 [Glutinoglossum americanum]|uniref:Uncharacterized protein n=1 Tax=Glutinoglossum americanum TaxID=1670608 RepID=A0A9P8I4G1_9PEZI|nr:hypothetical protein FGG08_000189 [Glutinoglossum americanum]